MTTRRFFACLALAFGVICAFNVFLAFKIDSVSKLIMRNMRATPRIDVLFLGNSLMQSGFDPVAFASAWPSKTPAPQTFNAGLGWSSPVEHYLLARQAYLHHQPIRCIVYGIYDFQLTEPDDFAWSDLEGNRSMGYSTEPSTAASLYAPGSTFEQWRFRAIGVVPMLREHSQLWKYVEIFRRSLQDIGMPESETNEFGRVTDFEAMALPDQPKFDQECESVVKNSLPFVPAVRELLRTAHEKNTQVIVIEMPMTSAHRDKCYSTMAWRQYRAYIRQDLEANGVTYVVGSDWITNDADFSDGLHLNATGSNAFSTKMAQLLADKLKAQ